MLRCFPDPVSDELIAGHKVSVALINPRDLLGVTSIDATPRRLVPALEFNACSVAAFS